WKKVIAAEAVLYRQYFVLIADFIDIFQHNYFHGNLCCPTLLGQCPVGVSG
ncbi:MAG: hypothetical protein ACJAX1_001256, partial [Neolewinella sp.]